MASESEAPKPTGPKPGAPLPRGRHDLPPEAVERHQLERIVAAVATVIAENGYLGLTVDRVTGIARVSRTTFYAHFENVREAAVVSHEKIFEDFLGLLTARCSDDPSPWPAKVGHAIAVTIEFAISRPQEGQILSTGLHTADPEMASRILASHDRLAKLLGGIRAHSPHGSELPACTEQFLIAAVAGVISGRLASGEAAQLRALQGDLIQLTLMPYCGVEEASRIASSG